MSPALPWRATATGLVLSLRVTPNARVEGISGCEVLADGVAVLAVKVRTVPEDGKANAAVVALLAKALDVPRSSFELLSGATARRKTFALSGDPAELAARLSRLVAPPA